MGIAPIGTAILRLALPMIIAMLAHSIYNMTDMFFIGQTKNPDMVAAVSLAFPLFMLSQAVGNIFAVGSSSYISRVLGAKDYNEARRTSAVSFYIALGTGILLTLLLLIFKTPLLHLIGASDATFGHTNDYFSITALFLPIAAAGVAMSGQMRSEGATQKAMVLQLIGIVLNIILDPIFILGCHMGTAGAAWATVIGQTASFAYGIYYFLSKKTILSISLREFKPHKKMMTQMLSIGIPAGFHNLIISISHILANRVAASYGDHVVAGNGVQMRLAGMFFMLVFALAQGYQPFAGYNYGAKQFDRLRKGFMITIVYATGICLAGSLILAVFGDRIVGFFINDAPTIKAGVTMLHAFVWGLPFIGSQITLMVSFQALGKPVQALVITVGRQLLFYAPLLYLLNHLFGFDGFIWAQPAADIMATGIAIVLGISLIKIMQQKTTVPPNEA